MRRKVNLLFFILIIFSSLLLTFGIKNSYAANDTVPFESVNPSDGFKYGMKRLEEKILLFVYSFSSEKKADYLSQNVKSRLAELEYIVDKKDQDNFENATTRYFSTVGQYTQFLNEKNLKDKKDAAKSTLNSEEPVLIRLRNTFDPTSAQWRFIQDDINYLHQYSQSI